MSITVPTGALAEDVTIDIEEDATGAPSLPPGMPLLGPVYALTPHGTQFAKPVTVRVPFDASRLPAGVAPLVLKAEPGGTFAPIPSQIDGAAMTATVSSFSYFAAARVGNIAAGSGSTCAMAGNGVKCWGANGYKQLGDGTTTNSTVPVFVKGLPQVATTIAGASPTLIEMVLPNCALLGAQYGLWCWGGQAKAPPTEVPGLRNANTISAGLGGHACAMMPGQVVQCWGDNSSGQLGDGTTTKSPSPVTVSGLTGPLSVSAGGSSTCAVLEDGTARCWGDSSFGQLGNGAYFDEDPTRVSTSDSSRPVVARVSDVASISVGFRHACALVKDGTVSCWGYGYSNPLGAAGSSSNPLAVPGVTTAVAISTGWDVSCALLSDRTVVCWGRGSLSAVPGLTNVDSISVGWDHRCAMLRDGSARCWGENDQGQLGNGTTRGAGTPVVVDLGGSVLNPGTGGASGTGGTSGTGGATGGAGGSTGLGCTGLQLFPSTPTGGCTVKANQDAVDLAMICDAQSCQCYADNVAFGAPFDVGATPCADMFEPFNHMYNNCGCQ